VERNELIRRIVLNEICDDYENIDQTIWPEAAKICEKCGFAVTRAEIVRALAELVKDGLAKAYRLSLSPGETRELEGMPLVGAVEEEGDWEIYFLSTLKGTELQLSDGSWWPLSEADEAEIEPAPPHVHPVSPPKNNKPSWWPRQTWSRPPDS